MGCWVRRCLYVFSVYSSAGALLLVFLFCRPLRTNWLMVGTLDLQTVPTLPFGRYFWPWAIREATASVCDGLALTVSIFKSQGQKNPRGPLPLKERQFTIRLKSLSSLFAALFAVVLTFTDTGVPALGFRCWTPPTRGRFLPAARFAGTLVGAFN